MRRYLLDTNICIFYMKGQYQLREKVREVGVLNCFISEITVAELLYGASCSVNKQRHLKQVNEFVEQFEVLPIYNTLPTFADVKAELRKNGNLIDDFDLLIGSTAIYYQMVAVTENVRHLSRLPHLVLENWIER